MVEDDVIPSLDGIKPAPQKNGDIEVEIEPRDGGRKKYSRALKTLLPYRKESPKRAGLLPSSHSGLCSFVTMTWLTPIMWKAFRQGLTKADLWELDESDKAEGNAKRLTRMWESEKLLVGPENASFTTTVWKFGKTRFYICIFLMLLSVMFQFLGPAWILKSVLAYQEDLSQPLEVGICLALLAFVSQLIRNLTFSGLWMIGIHTGMRLEGAMQYMTYAKMLRLRNGGDNVLSKAITFCTNDQERIFECVSGGVLAVAAPSMFIMCLVYTCIVLGPWAIVGNVAFFLFYPLMGFIGRTIGQLRRKTVKHTNKRVGLMTEIMNSIRLIKMYGWEDSFSRKIKSIREGEEGQLKKAAFMQSLTATLTPMVNIIASVLVFLAYTVSGNDLTPSEAFTIFSVFAAMQFTIGTLPFAIRSIAEARVCFQNFQKFLDLPEFEVVTEQDLDCNHDTVVAIQNGNFAWEVENDAAVEQKLKEKAETENNKKNVKKAKKGANKANGNPATSPEEVGLTVQTKVEKTVKLEDCLKAISLEVKRGSLTGVCGSVGSGKSSLLSAILGDMVKSSGRILIRGSLAIVSQQAWIYSDSFQENILFGSPMNKEKYEKVLDICCLRPDIQALANGDQTIIGERGVNLSGGQKQRVNLARSIYADKSIYLLDDPLAAVDSVISKAIFEKCIQQHLKDKTVILVTSAVQLLEDCDDIIFMKNGEIAERGAHSVLLGRKDHYYNLLQYHNQKESKTEDAPEFVENQDQKQSNVSASVLNKRRSTKTAVQIESFANKMTQDDSEYKFAGIKSYALYIKACGGYFFFTVLLFFLVMFGLTRIFSGIWLQRWLDAGDGQMEERRKNFTELNTTFSEQDLKGLVNDNPDVAIYQLVLASSVFVALFVGLVKGLLSTRLVLHGASCLHERMFLKIIKSPMSFFDVTPLGKITNRFSKDMDELDARLPFFIEFVLQAVIFILGSLLVVCLVYPLFAVGMVLILGMTYDRILSGPIMIFLDIWLNIGVRETKKLDNVLKTPVIHHLQSSLGGLSIIRTFHRQDQFKVRFATYINNHLSAESVYRSANRWFTVRMDFVGLVTIFTTIMMSVLFRGEVSPALVGLALSSIYTVCTFVPFIMRMKSELQSRFISVERILEYSEDLQVEEPESKAVLKPPEGWPKHGEIIFDTVNMRYLPDLPLVIQDVSFTIRPSEKIGIVGRTGAGKTSIIASLLRLYPIEKGTITIDGMNTDEISLKNLRSNIAVIPQDPVLFQGTLRYNLDPFDDYTDDELWSALEKSHIKPKIEKEEKKLLLPVSSEGENFSVGEKQLICLSRALLRKNKILLLDEATASLDIETDFLIQNTIREAFEHCTVITIAHRLNTVANYDRIIVMQAGKVVELDTPENLMESQGSLFHQMMIASGISSLDQLKKQPTE